MTTLIEDEKILKIYNNSCVAHPHKRSVCLHEEPPKSLNPSWRSMPHTRYPVCNECHMFVHNTSRIDAYTYLEEARDKYFPKAVEELQVLLAQES